MWGLGLAIFLRGVTEKGLISFAACESRERKIWTAAKVLRPLGELNRGVKPVYGEGMLRLRRMTQEWEVNWGSDRFRGPGGSGVRSEEAEAGMPTG